MDFHGMVFLLTIMTLVGNGVMLAVLITPAFGVTDALASSQSKEIANQVLPGGLQYWGNDLNSIDNTKLTAGDIKDENASFITTAVDMAQLISTSFIKIVGSAQYTFQLLIFLVVGYIFILQIAQVPEWFVMIVGLIIIPVQMFGLFYIGTYLYSVLKGRIA